MDMHSMEAMPGLVNETMTMATECDGTVDPSRKGSWQGHILPGAVIVVWGAWWAYNACLSILHASPARQYVAQPWYRMNMRRLAYLEPVLKVLLPFLAISVELYFDHSAYRYLYCPKGTRWEGRYAVTHMNNWQHTASYPAFVVSGITDLLCLAGVPLPAGAGQGVLSLAFSIMAFLMAVHKKHEPLDAAVHGLLFYCMALVATALLAEAARPRAPALGLARAAALVFLGSWLCEVGAIEFDGMPQWSTEYGGAAMFAPVVWAMIGLTVICALLTLFATLAALKRWSLLPTPARRVTGSGADAADDSPRDPVKPERGPPSFTLMAHAREGYSPVDSGRSASEVPLAAERV